MIELIAKHSFTLFLYLFHTYYVYNMSVTNIVSGHSMGEKSKNKNIETALKNMGGKIHIK